jgi:hypothetical protein
MILSYSPGKKRERVREKNVTNTRTMIHNESCESYKMNSQHVLLRKRIEEVRPGKT